MGVLQSTRVLSLKSVRCTVTKVDELIKKMSEALCSYVHLTAKVFVPPSRFVGLRGVFVFHRHGSQHHPVSGDHLPHPQTRWILG